MFKHLSIKMVVFFLAFSTSFSNMASAAINGTSTGLGKSSVEGNHPSIKSTPPNAATRISSFKQKYEPDQLIIKYKNNTSAVNVRSRHAFKILKKLGSIGAEVVKTQKGANIDSLINTLKNDPSVLSVQPNYKYLPTDLPNDPYFNKLWGLNNTGQNVNGTTGVNNMDIDYPEAMQSFNQLPDNGPVVVAVIDTGIDINHPDLKNNIWTNPGEIPNNGIDDDGNGYVDDVNGWDFYHHDNTVFDPEDGDEHGTHVAGTIAASGNNGIGITGIAPNVKIMPLKFIGPDGGSTADAISAIEYATRMGVKISNNSWAGGEDDQALKETIEKSNMLFVAAAGNDGLDNDQQPDYPASYDSPNIISVAALDNAGNLADFSNYGSQSVDIAAPGVNILSTVPKKSEIGAAAQINNTTSHYKAIFNGFGFENFSTIDRQTAFQKAVDYLGVTSASKILLVQDNESTASNDPVLNIYSTLLKNAGLSFTVRTVATDQDGPNLASLSGYDTVIWFTGDAMGSDNPNLTSSDISTLDQFLKKGSKSLLLSGEDILYQNENTSFVTDTLSLNISGEGETRPVTGAAGTIYDGDHYQLLDAPYADYVTSNNPDVAKINLNYLADENYDNAYAYFSGTSMATPHVTGVAALLENKYPDLNPVTLKNIILASGDSLASLQTKILSGKKLNAYKALTFNLDNAGVLAPPAGVNVRFNQNTPTVYWDNYGFFSGYNVYRKEVGTGSPIQITSSPVTGGHFQDGTAVPGKTYEYTVTSVDSSGKESNPSAPITYVYDDRLPGMKMNGLTATGELNADSDVLDIQAVTLTAGKTYSFSFNGPKGTNFDYRLYGSSTTNINTGTPIRSLTDSGSEEYVSYPVTKTGTYYIAAQAEQGAGKYTIKLTSKPTVKDDDIPVAIPLKTRVIRDFLDENDIDDVYSINLAKGDKVTLTMTSAATNGSDLDLYVYGPNSKTVDYESANYVPELSSSTQTDTSNESLTFTAKQTGKYYIDANLASGSAPYLLKILLPKPAVPQVNAVSDHSTAVSGTAKPYAKVTVKIGTKVYTGSANTNGAYSITIPVAKAGSRVSVLVTDAIGNSSASKLITVLDKTAPHSPKVNRVYRTTTQVTGTAEAYAVITVKAGSRVIGTAHADKAGRFNVKIKTQKKGTKLSITAADAAKNVSKAVLVKVL